jgi:multidrug resistance protein, MATE family
VTVRRGHLLGANEINSAKTAGYCGALISATLMTIIAICFWVFPTLLISVDFDINNPANAEIVKEIRNLFGISAVFQIIEALRISLFGALRALKDTNFTLLTSIISFWCIALPIGYLFATCFRLGGEGLWYGMVMGAACSVLLLYWRFKLKIRCYTPHNLAQEGRRENGNI